MVTLHIAPSKSRAPIVSARATATEGKGTINLRIDNDVRRLIDDAAAALGKTRTEFMIESARQQAVDALLDQRVFTLQPEHYDSLMQILDAPPALGPKLKSLLHHTPAWRE